ncbi:MAG TPA: hypothetical protein VJ874_07320, partial [Candidatus Thermoplasmatota archaeon]|nr:hypothetical protein [Candidatus Thermoplasmatota archaeon]
MQGWRLASGVLLVLLAGCLGDGSVPPSPGTGPQAAEPTPPLYSAECSNALLFQFVEYADTDAYLPPGFHPRDPQAFLGSPAAFGKAGVLMIAIDCTDEAGVRYAAGSVDIFVEAPVVDVDGLDAATFNFFEVERSEPPGPFTQALASIGWPMVPGEVSVNITLGSASNSAAGTAEVLDGEGRVGLFGGAMGAPVPLGNATVRFWHDGPKGLGFIEYQGDLQPITGSGYCFLREGTAMADFAQSTPAGDLGPAAGLGCPPGEPVMATFPHFRMDA